MITLLSYTLGSMSLEKKIAVVVGESSRSVP